MHGKVNYLEKKKKAVKELLKTVTGNSSPVVQHPGLNTEQLGDSEEG